MNIHTFIANYQEAFGQHAELPIAFWYSDRMGGIYRESNRLSLQMHETSQRRQNRQSQQRNNHLRRRQVLYRIYRNARARPGFCLLEREIQEDSRNGGRFCQ